MLSLFDDIRQALADDAHVIRCTKATLVHVSHTLEDMMLRRCAPVMMFTGFQESSHWRKETARYAHLAQTAQQVCIFAGKPLPDDSLAKVIQITLEAEDPLRQEWFVTIFSEDFSVLLCGKDQSPPADGDPTDEALREFETILSFTPVVINRALDRLEAVLAHYRPDILARLRAARQRFPVLFTRPELVTELISNLVSYEERLIGEVRLNEMLKHQEAMLRLELEKEREMSALRHLMLKTIAHEFRTPLTVIHSSTELLEYYFDALPPEKRQQRLSAIRAQVQQLRSLMDMVDTVLTSSAGGLIFRPRSLDIVALCETLIAELEQTPIIHHTIRFHHAWSAGRIMADERLLRLILSNLLTNAAKFSPGRDEIALTLSQRGAFLALEVRDWGIGIPEDNRERIYEAFYRGSNVGTIGGTGLGLRIAHDCTHLHGGSIDFRSSGDGTAFVVMLPLVPA